MGTRAQLLHHLREGVLGDRKEHRDRLQLREHHHAIRIGSVNDVAGVDQTQPSHAGDRGNDLGVSQL